MNNKNFEGAEITVYTAGGETMTLDLSKTQLFVVLKILGVDFRSGMRNTYSCHSDETLLKLFEYKGNPLNLTYKDE